MNNLINNIILMYTYIFMINIYKYILCLMLIFFGVRLWCTKAKTKASMQHRPKRC